MWYHLYVGDLCEHDSILGSLLDLLSVCVRDCMAIASQLTQVRLKSSPLVEESYLMFMIAMLVCMWIIEVNLKGRLGTSREGVWAVSCVT